MLSMGFGFVEFKFQKHAKEAIKTLQGHELHEHALTLKHSTKSSANASTEKQVTVNPEEALFHFYLVLNSAKVRISFIGFRFCADRE